MKKTFIVGQYLKENMLTHTKALGNLIIELSDIAVDDWKHEKQKLSDKPLTNPKTVSQVLASGKDHQVTFYHPVSQQRYTLDLSPWKHVDGNRYLRIDMGWVRI